MYREGRGFDVFYLDTLLPGLVAELLDHGGWSLFTVREGGHCWIDPMHLPFLTERITGLPVLEFVDLLTEPGGDDHGRGLAILQRVRASWPNTPFPMVTDPEEGWVRGCPGGSYLLVYYSSQRQVYHFHHASVYHRGSWNRDRRHHTARDGDCQLFFYAHSLPPIHQVWPALPLNDREVLLQMKGHNTYSLAPGCTPMRLRELLEDACRATEPEDS